MEFDNDDQQQDSQEIGDFSFEKSHTGKKKVRKGTKKKKSHRKTKEGDSLNQTGNSQNESQKEITEIKQKLPRLIKKRIIRRHVIVENAMNAKRVRKSLSMMMTKTKMMRMMNKCGYNNLFLFVFLPMLIILILLLFFI